MKLHIDDKHLAFSFDSDEEKNKISGLLTYEDMSKAYSRNGFDKRRVKQVCFLKKLNKYYICGSGFIYEVLKYSRENDVTITEIEDKRTKFNHNEEKYEYDYLRKFFNPDFKYVEHQIKILKTALKTNVAIFKAVTSSGKTDTIIAIMKATKLPTLILVNKVTLAIQTKERVEQAGIPCGIMTGSKSQIKENMVATIGSVKKIPDLHNYKMLIVDEVHNAASAQFQDFFSKTSYPIRFGFSATPEGNSKLNFAKIRQYFGSVLVEITAQELMDNDVIVKPKITFIETECPKTLDWPSAREEGITNNIKRNDKIVEIVNKYNLPTLILITNIEHGQILNGLIDNSTFVSGIDDADTREKVINDFRSGKIKVLISSNIFNEGISINEIRLLIIASGGKSSIQTTQKLGRSLRKDKDKDVAIVYDFWDEGNRFTLKHSMIRYAIYKKLGFQVEK